MEIISYLPSILLAMVIAFVFAFHIRLIMEGASLKTAVISVIRFIFIPIALFFVINHIFEQKRKFIFSIRKDVENEKYSDKIEHLLEKRSRLVWIVIKISVKFYRQSIDSYIKASIEYERKQMIKVKKKKTDNFYDYYFNDIDAENHILHS